MLFELGKGPVHIRPHFAIFGDEIRAHLQQEHAQKHTNNG